MADEPNNPWSAPEAPVSPPVAPKKRVRTGELRPPYREVVGVITVAPILAGFAALPWMPGLQIGIGNWLSEGLPGWGWFPRDEAIVAVSVLVPVGVWLLGMGLMIVAPKFLIGRLLVTRGVLEPDKLGDFIIGYHYPAHWFFHWVRDERPSP